jgi:hypothetical protein
VIMRKKPVVKAIPAELGDPSYITTYGRVGVPELIAVAGVYNTGELWANDVNAKGEIVGSNVATWVPIFGPAKSYSCAYMQGVTSDFYLDSGTSGGTLILRIPLVAIYKLTGSVM